MQSCRCEVVHTLKLGYVSTEIFNPMVSAWFGDLGDGVHDGTATDPRVELIVVEPTEIRYWKKTQTNLGQLANVVVSAATG